MEYNIVSKILNKGKLEDVMGRQSNMISIAYYSHTMHNYMKEQVAANATNDDVTMEAVLVYEMQNIKFLSDDLLHNYTLFIDQQITIYYTIE